ncbi:armadillo-type protein [Hysterangium stoloniferum]|nr:armadillo-type protein [Hysterangium stoloniferum]
MGLSVLGKVLEQAKFRAAIAGVIPTIVELLNNSSWCVQLSVVSVLGNVSEQVEFRTAIAPVIPAIVELLRDSNDNVRSRVLSILGKVSEQAEFRTAIKPVIPAIVALLEDTYFHIQTQVVDLLVKLAAHDVYFDMQVNPFPSPMFSKIAFVKLLLAETYHTTAYLLLMLTMTQLFQLELS